MTSKINQSKWILLSLYNVMLTGAACLPIISLVKGERNLAIVVCSFFLSFFSLLILSLFHFLIFSFSFPLFLFFSFLFLYHSFSIIFSFSFFLSIFLIFSIFFSFSLSLQLFLNFSHFVSFLFSLFLFFLPSHFPLKSSRQSAVSYLSLPKLNSHSSFPLLCTKQCSQQQVRAKVTVKVKAKSVEAEKVNRAGVIPRVADQAHRESNFFKKSRRLRVACVNISLKCCLLVHCSCMIII